MSTRASANLVFGRYALDAGAPAYQSSRCTVLYATDMSPQPGAAEANDAAGRWTDTVALKCVSDREAWLKECWMRGVAALPTDKVDTLTLTLTPWIYPNSPPRRR